MKLKLYETPITPAYIVDIRNEFKHIPAFISYTHFLYYLNDKKNQSRYIKSPVIKGYYHEGQLRFCFNSTEELLKLFRVMLHFRNCTIVFDEADALFNINSKIKKSLEDVFLGSRNNNVSSFFIGKRPSLIPILVRSQADKFTIFCVEEEYDIRYFENRVKQSFPKDIFKLERGEAVLVEHGEKPRVETFERFAGES